MLAYKARSRKGPGRGAVISLSIGAAVLLFSLLGIWGISRGPERLRLKVAGDEIGEEAYSWAMYKARNEILSMHSAAGISPVEWDVRTELGLPSEMVSDRAVEILKEFYAVGTLAVERGYLEDAGFDALEQARQALNKSKQEAVASGGIVTGLTSYSMERYIDYRNESLRRQFCDDEANPEMVITEQELTERYEQDKDRFYALPDSFRLSWIQVQNQPQLEEQLGQLRVDAVESGSLTKALEQYPQLAVFHREEYFDGGNYAAYEREYSFLLACADELQRGEFSRVICQDGQIWLIACVERKENGYADFGSVAAVVKGNIRKERYDALVTSLAGQISAEYDAGALYSYTAGRLG